MKYENAIRIMNTEHTLQFSAGKTTGWSGWFVTGQPAVSTLTEMVPLISTINDQPCSTIIN